MANKKSIRDATLIIDAQIAAGLVQSQQVLRSHGATEQELHEFQVVYLADCKRRRARMMEQVWAGGAVSAAGHGA